MWKASWAKRKLPRIRRNKPGVDYSLPFVCKLDGQWRIECQQEVRRMIAAAWLMLSSLMYSLQLSAGSFPKPLSPKEEAHYLALAAEGNLEARNILIERNLRLVAHIMNNG